MDHFAYRNRELFCEDVPVQELAETYGTPLYVYSEATLVHHLTQIQNAFASANPIICYSVKTNGNLSICSLMAKHGSGFDDRSRKIAIALPYQNALDSKSLCLPFAPSPRLSTSSMSHVFRPCHDSLRR